MTEDLALKERDRLLRDSARVIGLTALGVSVLCLVMPGIVSERLLVAVLLLIAVVGASLVRVGRSPSLGWPVLGLAAGIGILLVIAPPGDALDAPVATALVPLAGGTLAAFGIALTGSVIRLALLLVAFLTSSLLVGLAAPGGGFLSVQSITVVLGWILAVVFAFWFGSGIPRAMASILSIGSAHRAERHASETEAQRRQSARLLHDTVLATLTLLAHSGVGVSSDALRDQAREDANLLRQLRLGGSPVPTKTGSIAVQAPPSEIVLGHTLESVKQRFGRMGLDVSWHGTGQVLLAPAVLDSFLLALAECLENVRRHSGVSDAHVTITEDDDTVRAMVTDSGVGFSLEQVDPGRLGFRDSIVGRLSEVGGSARVFSSPGSGTTVVLEVPR